MHTFLRLLLLVCAVIAPAAGAASAQTSQAVQAAQTALWRIVSGEAEMILFGTIHIMREDADWLDPELAMLAGGAGLLVLETSLDEESQTRAAMLAARHARLPEGERLSALLSEPDRARLARTAEMFGRTAEALETMRPWMVSLTLSLDHARTQGQLSEHGADALLFSRARAADGRIAILETPEQQIEIFANLSRTGELAMLTATLREILDTPDLMTEMDAAWASGDMQRLSEMVIEGMRRDAPELYEAALAARNRDWTAQLDTMLRREQGRIFVAVGAAHLLGPDSLQAMLAEHGHHAERIR